MKKTLRERYEGNFLKGEDLPEGAVVTVTIEGWVDSGVEKDSGGQMIDGAIFQFQGKDKRMIINATNYKVLKATLGVDYYTWPGKKIMLQRRYLDYKKTIPQKDVPHKDGHNTICLRFLPEDCNWEDDVDEDGKPLAGPRQVSIGYDVRRYMGLALPHPPLDT